MAVSISSLGIHLVGASYPEFKFIVTSEWVKAYKKSLGYSEDEIQDDHFVPSTFGAAFRDSEFAAFQKLGIDLRQLLHAQQQQRFFLDIKVGDIILGRASLQRLVQKRSKVGDIVFLELKNIFRRIGEGFKEIGQEIPIIESVTTVVVRDLAEGTPEAPNHIRPMGTECNRE